MKELRTAGGNSLHESFDLCSQVTPSQDLALKKQVIRDQYGLLEEAEYGGMDK